MRRFQTYISAIVVALSIMGMAQKVSASVSPSVRVERYSDVRQGERITVSIIFDMGDQPASTFGGFDLLLNYDYAAILLLHAWEGDLISNCDWEYFYYQFGPNGYCGDQSCPMGTVRITAFGEAGLYNDRPTCLLENSGVIAKMNFIVSDDRTLEDTFVPIDFIWYNCRDNKFSNARGDSSSISQSVYDAFSNNITDSNTSYPTLTGAQNADCFPRRSYNEPDRAIDFYSGGLDILLTDSIDVGADINLDGKPADSADFYLFVDYFLFGTSVFTIDLNTQIFLTDVNRDGDNLTISDLILLARIIESNAHLNLSPIDTSIHTARFTQNFDLKTIEVETPDTLGAVRLIFNDSILPSPLDYPMEMRYRYDSLGKNTRVLIYSLNGETLPEGVILNYKGNAALTHVETAGYSGTQFIRSVIDRVTSVADQTDSNLPRRFSLHQNYPNPFNPVTTISFELPQAGEYQLEIINIAGQEVTAFTGNASAGIVDVRWDATGMASGIYYYRLTAGESSTTKKMLLLK